MRVLMNGKSSDVAEGETIASLIGDMQLNPEAVVVELNSAILSNEEWEKTVLSTDDKLEIVTFVGGG